MVIRATSGIHVALLRGINVGGRNRLPMKALVKLFDAIGCTDVRTYIQSGNVLFRAAPSLARRVPALVGEAIEEHHGIRSPVVLRTAAALEEVVKFAPSWAGAEGVERLHVAFLSDMPTRSVVATLDPDRSPPDRFVVRGREIYLVCPQGIARSRLTNAYFDAKLGTTSTIRNWRTVMRLVELARE